MLDVIAAQKKLDLNNEGQIERNSRVTKSFDHKAAPGSLLTGMLFAPNKHCQVKASSRTGYLMLNSS
jgi:hypothetical protein